MKRRYFQSLLWVFIFWTVFSPVNDHAFHEFFPERSAYASDWQEDPQEAQNQPGSDSHTRAVDSDKKDSNIFVLRGRVEHANHVDGLSENLQAGAKFNSSSLSQGTYASKWFKIPDWFAGTFQSLESSIDYVKDYATGRSFAPGKKLASSAVELHGHQKDKNGEIWHFYVESGSSKSEQSRQLTLNKIDWYGPELVDPKKVIMRILATSLIVDKRSGLIVDSFRREDIKTYQAGENGAINVTYSSKSFDSKGRPRDLQTGTSVYRKIADFSPIDRDTSHDYAALFQDFLKSSKSR